MSSEEASEEAKVTSQHSSMRTDLPAWKRSLPMWLTWSRILVCPLFVVLFALPGAIWGWLSAFLFTLASGTDWLDGYYARKYNATSNMGKFMDPIADKILVSTVLIMLIPTGRIGPVLVILLLTRDIFIGGIRSVAAADNLIISAKPAGKWKTAIQMMAIPVLLIPLGDYPAFVLHGLGHTLLWISVILSTFSAYQYIQLYNESKKKV